MWIFKWEGVSNWRGNLSSGLLTYQHCVALRITFFPHQLSEVYHPGLSIYPPLQSPQSCLSLQHWGLVAPLEQTGAFLTGNRPLVRSIPPLWRFWRVNVGLITMCRLLESGVLVVTRTSFRICCLRTCALAHQSYLINTGLEHIQLTWEHGEHDSKLVCFLASTWKGALSLVISFGGSSWVSLRSCSSPSCFHVARLSNSRRILTTRDDTDWSHGGTFAVLTYYITPTCEMWLQPPVLSYQGLRKHAANPGTCFGVLFLSCIDSKLHLSQLLSTAVLNLKNSLQECWSGTKKKKRHTYNLNKEKQVQQRTGAMGEKQDFIACISTFVQTTRSLPPGSRLGRLKIDQDVTSVC